MVRPAVRDDLDGLAALATEAFAAKYGPAFGPDARAGVRALVGAALGHPDMRILVAHLDGRLAGVVQLVLGPGPADAAVQRALVEAVGAARTARASLVLGLLRPPRVSAERAYLDSLAVAPWARRRGVARALVQECGHHAREARKGAVVLLVTADNAPALALYADMGFRTIARKRWWLARIAFGSPGAVIMEWPLPRG